MKKWVRVLMLILLCGFAVILSGGLALGMYYQSNFPVNTWINGIYCTGKSIEEVNGNVLSSVMNRDGVSHKSAHRYPHKG